MVQFLDWLDEAAGGFIRLAYLAAGITAVALYFGAGHLPGAVEQGLNAALPWTLAAAIETHTYGTARRVRAAWQDHAIAALKVNLAILGGLLAFSSWNQLNYLYLTWTPPQTALALPGWTAYLIRALIVPCAFMAAAFLAPLAPPIGAQLEVEARATLADVFRIARKQRRRRLKDAERSGRDMTAALVDLVPDPDARRIIAHAYRAIGAPITSQALQLVEDTRPALAPARSPQSNVVQLVEQRTARKRQRVRTPSTSVEHKARAVWQPGISVEALQVAAGISRGSAQKYHAKLSAEDDATRVELAQ